MILDDIRTIRKIVTGREAVDGAGVKLVRVFGHNDVKDFDPFLMMDAFDSVDPDDYIKGFPWHPHRGIETITYIVSGNIEHEDSLGNKGRILDGECQWMTAGSGIIHQEMPKPSKRMLGFQSWLNLPSKHKMAAPNYHGISKENTPVIEEEDNRIHVISGSYNGRPGAMEGDYVKLLYLDVEVGSGAEWYVNTDRAAALFVYILEGEGSFGPDNDSIVSAKHAVLFNEGNRFRVKASDKGIRFILMAGNPLREPVVWGGPIVMNTREELNLALKEIDEDRFIK